MPGWRCSSCHMSRVTCLSLGDHVTNSRVTRELSRRWHPWFSVTTTSLFLTILRLPKLSINFLQTKKLRNKKIKKKNSCKWWCYGMCEMLALSRSLSDWRGAASEHPSPSQRRPSQPSSSGQWDLNLMETLTRDHGLHKIRFIVSNASILLMKIARPAL